MNRQEAAIRAKELVARMTPEEKITQLRYNAPAIDRLGIPAYNWWNEALHGVARAGEATMFPQAIGLAATFDRELIADMAGIIAEEGRAKYNAFSELGDRDIYKGLTFWSPNVNLFRDPRWGRGQETYGEDPYLSGALGTAYVRALQGDGEHMKAAACAKHFAVHSGPEELRHRFDARVSQKDLHESYLPAFEMVIKDAKPEAVMGAYNRTNGEPCCASPSLQKILREDWGFEGHFVSDCWAVRDFHENHHVTETAEESAALAINNGCDLNCGNTFLHLLDAFRDGLVTEETITRSCERLFTTRFLLGLFDETEYDDIPFTAVECPEHLAKAEQAARESIVLLKNDGLLPLDRTKIRTIGVIGPNADSRKALTGNYHGTSCENITLLEGIRRAAGPDVRVLYAQGCDLSDSKVEKLAEENDRISEAVMTAEYSDVVVLVVGLNENLEGEEGDTGNAYASGDKGDLLLPAPQRELIRAIAQTGKPVVLCLMAGSCIDLTEETEAFGAILNVWYPGARGGDAAAAILFGDESPSGKLCVTFYRDSDPLPEFTDYSMKGRTYRYLEEAPLYPFGYGLSYGDVRVNAAVLDRSAMQVSVTCANEGAVKTGDVLQVYVKVEDPDAPRNPRLCGFGRVTLEAGQESVVTLDLDPHTFEVYGENGERHICNGECILFVGTNGPDARSVELTGKRPVTVTA